MSDLSPTRDSREPKRREAAEASRGGIARRAVGDARARAAANGARRRATTREGARRRATGRAREATEARDDRRANPSTSAAMGCAASTTGARGTAEAGDARASTSAPSAVRIDERWDANYVARRKIGGGKQGTVFEVEASDGTRRAMKETHVGTFGEDEHRIAAYAEVEALSAMSHPNVVAFVGAYQTSAEVHLVMELVDGTSLLEYLTMLNDYEDANEDKKHEVRLDLMRQLANAVAYVHAKDYVFRDLALENVMVRHAPDDATANVTLKIIDFGRVRKLRPETGMRLPSASPMGAASFQAPEVEERGEYSQASDMWSVGIFMYWLSSGKMPFQNSVEGVFQVLRAEYDSLDESISALTRDLVHSLLRLNPVNRMNAAQAAAHPCLKQKKNAAHRRAAQAEQLQVPKHMLREARRQLSALTMHESLEKHTAVLLAELLRPQDVKVLRRWLGMRADVSVRRGKVYKVRYSDAGGSTSGSDSTIRGARGYAEAMQTHDVLDKLYRELHAREAHQEGSFTDGSRERRESFNKLADAFERFNIPADVDETEYDRAVLLKSAQNSPEGSPGIDDTAMSPGYEDLTANSDSSRSLSEFLNETAPRSFMGLAHDRGMISLDELISACLSAGLVTVADELQGVRSTLKFERDATLAELGIQRGSEESALFDIMLFRHTDLLSKVETLQMERIKSFCVTDEAVNRVFDGTVASFIGERGSPVVLPQSMMRQPSLSKRSQFNVSSRMSHDGSGDKPLSRTSSGSMLTSGKRLSENWKGRPPPASSSSSHPSIY